MIRVFTEGDHKAVMFRACPRRCFNGRMFWDRAEPKFARQLGFVGICSHCGAQTFTQDLLVPVEPPTDARFVGSRKYDLTPTEHRRRLRARRS